MMRMSDEEAFKGLQFSKGYTRCTKCTLIRPMKATTVADGKRICKDVHDCARMKFLKEEDDRGEARVAAEQDAKADKKFLSPSSSPAFWNHADLFPI